MKKTVLALVLVFTLPILMSTQFASAAHTAPDVHLTGNCITSPSDVYGAAPNQNNPLLRDTELYIGDSLGRLHKVEQSDGSSCLIGIMKVGSVTVECTDLAYDPITDKLHCIDSETQTNPQSQCYEIDRTTAVATAIASITFGGNNVNDLNAFEIDTFGNAKVAGELGKIYNMDHKTTCNLTNKQDLTTGDGTGGTTLLVRSSGDLIFNPVTNNDFYLTSFDCDGCAFNCQSGGNPAQCNGLYNWNVPTSTLTFIADTGFMDVFAGDFVKTTQNICFLNKGQTLFQLDPNDGSFVSSVGTSVAAFGGTALDVIAGTLLIIDKTALLLAGMQSSAVWIAPFVLAGLGLAAFIISRKI